LGFSLGGMIAQQLAADHPDMVRRIILSGTGPRGGEGMVFDEQNAQGSVVFHDCRVSQSRGGRRIVVEGGEF